MSPPVLHRRFRQGQTNAAGVRLQRWAACVRQARRLIAPRARTRRPRFVQRRGEDRVFIDNCICDRATNLPPAQAFGIRTIRFENAA
jgi:hypothetical protein